MNDAKIVENKALKEKYFAYRHKSGLDIYVIPKNHTTTYAIFATKYGSVDSVFKTAGESDFTEVPDGIAHFLEHKLFEDENGQDAFKKYAETGASANAYTSFDRTAYLFSCTDNFEESLEILLDMVTHPYFSEKTVTKEQGIIGQEIKMYDDNADWQVYFGLLGALYSRHAVRLDIAGTLKSISEITPEILYKCYNTFYNFSNMALCVCGDVDPEVVLRVADKVLTEQPVVEIARRGFNEPREVAKERVIKKLKVASPKFMIGIKDNDLCYGGARLAKKNAELDIINEILFGKAGRFYSEMYSKGLINHKFGAGTTCNESYGHVEIFGESREPLEVFARVKDVVEAARSRGLDREDFERCKRVMYARSIAMFDSTDNVANGFISCLFDGYDVLDYPGIVGSVTYEDAQARFMDYYKPERCAVSVVEPL